MHNKIVYNITFFLLFFLLLNVSQLLRSSAVDDDIMDSPDIELDDSLSSDSDFDDNQVHDTKNNYKNNYDPYDYLDNNLVQSSNQIPYKKSSKELPPLKKDDICSLYNNSPYCECQRFCTQYPSSKSSECNCGSGYDSNENPLQYYTNIDNEQPPLLSSQPSLSYSPIVSQPSSIFDCSSSANTGDSMCGCQKSCLPGIPLSYDPCVCTGIDTQGTNNQANSYFNNISPQVNEIYQNPSYPSDQMVNMNSYNTQLPHFDSNSCTRACMPYLVEQNSPCMCNFDMKNDNLNAFQPNFINSNIQSMYPSYNNDIQSPIVRQQQPQQQAPTMLNANIPKVNRPITSVGAYLGCYHDKKKPGRDLKMSIPIPKLTPDSCIVKCREKKKRFAAVQNGYLCFCGSRFGRFNRTKDELCGTPCTGDPKKYCGGHWLNAVYSTDGQIYSPRQFSFKTRDPLDEIEYEEKLKSSKKAKTNIKSKHQNKKNTKSKLSIKSSSNNLESDSLPKSQKTVQNKPENRRTIGVKQNIVGKTVLENASSPSHMAELIAVGTKKNIPTGSRLASRIEHKKTDKKVDIAKDHNKKMLKKN